jgi:DnaJ-class molecular chaperone
MLTSINCLEQRLYRLRQHLCDRENDRRTAGIERWGTGDMVEQAFTGFVALPAPKSPYEILGVRSNASDEEIEAAFRAKAKKLHSDLGGSDDAMAELNAARARLKELAA